MPRITIEAVHADGQPRRWTLSERVAAPNLDSDHYVAQLVERLGWATADAEAIEAQSAPSRAWQSVPRRANPGVAPQPPARVPVPSEAMPAGSRG